MTGLRYLITYSDGGAGMRHHAEPLEVSDELDDCGERYRVVSVEQPASEGRVRTRMGRPGHGRKSV